MLNTKYMYMLTNIMHYLFNYVFVQYVGQVVLLLMQNKSLEILSVNFVG